MDKIYERLFHIIRTSDGSNDGIKLINKLIAKGANVNFKCDRGTPLMLAASYGESLVPTLLKLGANINDQTENGKSAIWFAVNSYNTQTVKLLIEHNANVDLVVTNHNCDSGYDFYETPLSSICERYRKELSNECNIIIDLLVKNGANINFTSKNTNTLLMTAVSESKGVDDKYGLVKLLLELGVDYKKVNRKGKTALDIAKDIKNDSIINILTAYEHHDRLHSSFELDNDDSCLSL